MKNAQRTQTEQITLSQERREERLKISTKETPASGINGLTTLQKAVVKIICKYRFLFVPEKERLSSNHKHRYHSLLA